MGPNEPAIHIVIPNWNGKKFLKKCLESLSQQTFRDFSITVVDNGSSDGSVSFLQRKYPEINCIRFSRNKGFSVAVNAGIKSSSSPLILLLNNDIEVAKDCLEQLNGQVARHRECEFFALKMLNFHHRNRLDGAGDGVLRGGVGYRYGTMEEDGEPYNQDGVVFGACAGAALYRRSFFDKVGFFDEDFFAYLEDVDLNLRAGRLGLCCYYIPAAVVYHIGSATTGSKINAMTVSLSTKNNFNIIVKNYPFALLVTFFPAMIIYQFFWFLFVLKKRKVVPYLKGLALGVAQLPAMLHKRKKLLRQQGLSVLEFARLIKESEYRVINSIKARREAAGKRNTLLNVYQKFF